jgi:hypothetical protein
MKKPVRRKTTSRPRPRSTRGTAESIIAKYESLAAEQAKIQDYESRNRKKLGRALREAVDAAVETESSELLARVTSATAPLLRGLPIYNLAGDSWAEWAAKKSKGLVNCFKRCRRNHAKGTQGRKICMDTCWAYALLCELA